MATLSHFLPDLHICISELHLSYIRRQYSISQQVVSPKTNRNLGKHAFSVAAPRVWNELLIALKSSENIATFRKKLDIFIPNCISTIHRQWFLVLIITFARPCS